MEEDDYYLTTKFAVFTLITIIGAITSIFFTSGWLTIFIVFQLLSYSFASVGVGVLVGWKNELEGEGEVPFKPYKNSINGSYLVSIFQGISYYPAILILTDGYDFGSLAAPVLLTIVLTYIFFQVYIRYIRYISIGDFEKDKSKYTFEMDPYKEEEPLVFTEEGYSRHIQSVEDRAQSPSSS
jgi:hypothetical protein